MRVKLAWLVRVGGARPPPFTTITIFSKVAVYAQAEWADKLTLFYLYQYMYSVVRGLQRDVVSWLTNSASYIYESNPNAGGWGGVAGSQPMTTAVHRSPNKLWRSNSIFNLWLPYSLPPSQHSNRIATILLSLSLSFFSLCRRYRLVFARWRDDGALQRISHLCIPFLGIARPQPEFPHSCVCERFI